MIQSRFIEATGTKLPANFCESAANLFDRRGEGVAEVTRLIRLNPYILDTRLQDNLGLILRTLNWTRRMNATFDFWNSIPGPELLDSEANVEHRLVLPLLHALGYRSEDIESKYPVDFQQGTSGRKHEADFVCFSGVLHDKTNSLVVVEVKASGKPLPAAKAQGESYAQNLKALLLLVTNGQSLEIWQMQLSRESHCVLQIPISQLAANRGQVERLLNKTAVRDYCAKLEFKSIIEAPPDFGAYETAELIRLKADPPAIARTLRLQQVGDNETNLDSTRLLEDFPSGAVVIGPSGFGKTTLSRSIFKQAIEERWRSRHKAVAFEAPSPDLEESSVDFLAFLHQRVAAHQPGITLYDFEDSLRKFGATIICDSLDRTSQNFQKRIATTISLFLRDYPLSQVFMFARADAKPMIALPTLELTFLSDHQVRELESVILTDGSAKHYSIIGAASPTLRSLCGNPLILRLALEYWRRERDFPRNVDILFRAWLSTVLETEPNDPVSRALRESALSIIAQATMDAPLTDIKAIALLRDNGISEDALNELIRCNAVRETDAVLEVQHDGLADYLRAKSFARKSVQDQLDAIPNLALSPGSFLPVLLMAQLVERDVRDALWRRLASGSIGIYFEALRYRLDVPDELKYLGAKEFSLRYLTDLLNGLDEPLDGFFPAFRSPIVEWLTEERDTSLAIIGAANAHSLHYKIQSQQLNAPRVVVGLPDFPGTIRGVNLDLARYRTDSARLLGVTLLEKGLEEVVDTLDVNGGPLWSAERLIARVRLLAQRYQFGISVNDDLNHIEKALQPYANKRIDEGISSGPERFSFQSMLDDIAGLRAAGKAALDPWWLHMGWKDDISLVSNEDLAGILNEEYRRVQLVYAEIIDASLSRFANDMIFFPILPIRWNLTVVRRGAFNRTFVIFPRWTPVKDWKDAGADVTFAEKGPDRYPPWEEARDALTSLGRPIHIPHYGGFTTHFGYDGTQPNGYFSGATPVTNEVVSWLHEELRGMFRNLPSGDRAFAV
jgi:Type I restriction enzyme R protein N terminus (HSDR_N)